MDDLVELAAVVSTPLLPIGPVPPATLIRISIRPPNFARTLAMAASTASGSVTSQEKISACTPIALASPATGSIAPVSRPSRARFAPSRANPREIAAPMPLAGPVTTTILSLS
jgi:hypothetical protein